ncbi:N-acetyl-gamma-glutamyl-phosphate reductase [Candidatus Cyanaurora vandensis]|uniref:N-acetyl-gamma-glutamyl-phosphate reductase n=1 Tax=Candidatus Cyanaurora vandensis TaxID=2714958 RepID=UPI002579808A|nr:N-acetyl-gamma-glutamyl-phosphate reductase [Candidatus Cyanaurora vandensis]
MKTTVGIVGATGYGGLQLIRILMDHPEVELTYLGANRNTDVPIQKLYPFLPEDKINLICEPIVPSRIIERCQVVFMAVPNGIAADLVPELVAGGCQVLDLSADYRFQDLHLYEQWYAKPRTDHATAQQSVYGLPELYRERIKRAQLIGCPGCYPTASLLAAAPLLKQGLVLPESLIIDAKSGTSGAGREAHVDQLFAEVDGSVRAYKIGRHRHTPEIEQICSDLAGTKNIQVQFTPHLVPMTRGILVTLYGQMRDPGLVTEDILTIYEAFYRHSPFVKVFKIDIYPQTKWVIGTNNCFIGLEADSRTGRVVVVAVIDNLLKGQSAQAVQCLNLRQGWPETLGLPQTGYYP